MKVAKLPAGPRWCFSTLGCHDLDLDGIASLASKFGINEVELSFLEGTADLTNYFVECFETPEKLRATLEQKGLYIPVINSRAPLANLDDDAKESLLALAQWAEGSGMGFISVLEGVPGADGRPAFDQLKKAINWWRAERKSRGWQVDLILETSEFLTTSDLILEFQAQLDEPMGLLWDTHSTWHQGREDLNTTWVAIAPWVKHMHFKDSVPTTFSRYEVAYSLPGDGKFPIFDLLNFLWQDGYNGAWSFEWERRFHPFLPPLEEALSALARITAQPETAKQNHKESVA